VCVEIPFNIRLDRLHDVLQTAMGWMNSHLYEMRWRRGLGIDQPRLADVPLDARSARLNKIAEDTTQIPCVISTTSGIAGSIPSRSKT
jgi:hypothetical protein